jgi:hypothetical protein
VKIPLANSTNAEATLCFRPHVSRIDEKGAGASQWEEAPVGVYDRSGLPGEPGEPSGSEASFCLPPGGCGVADEIERTRLITDITRLIRESAVPEGARLAGLTLIGWLARRRTDEVPHAIGVEEARESERRIGAARPKVR